MNRPLIPFFLFPLLMLPFLMLHAQEVEISSFEKINSNIPYLKILGKNNMGTLIHRYGKKTDLIISYDDELDVQWKKSINFRQKGVSIARVEIVPDGLLIFYRKKEGNDLRLYAQKAVGDLQFKGSPIFLGDLKGTRGERVKVILSKDKRKVATYIVYPQKDGTTIINTNLMDRDLKILSQNETVLSVRERPAILKKVYVNNEGLFFFVSGERANRKRKDFAANTYWVSILNPGQSTIEEIELHQPGIYLKEVEVGIDNINNNVVLAGLFANRSANIASGMFYTVIDLESMEYLQKRFEEFNSELVTKLTGKSKNKTGGLSSFKVDQLILRQDGGAIMVTESEFTTTETRGAPSFYPSMFYSTITYTYYHYNDLLVFSIHPDGTTHWHKIIRKKQFSEGDDGFYSSYNLSFDRNEMQFIFNEEVSANTAIIKHSINGIGEMEKEIILGDIRDEILLVPRLGKQIGSKELILPSIFRNKLRLVKLTF